jgi:hypothetical protein
MTPQPFRVPGSERVHPMLQPMEARMILVAGADATLMRLASIEIFRAGHVPVMVDWLAAPLLALPESDRSGDQTVDEILNLSERLLARCDGVLRVEGPAATADAMVGFARARGLRVFFSLQEALDG